MKKIISVFRAEEMDILTDFIFGGVATPYSQLRGAYHPPEWSPSNSDDELIFKFSDLS